MKKEATEGKKISVTHITKYLHLKYTKKKSKTQTEDMTRQQTFHKPKKKLKFLISQGNTE